jgi:hypothetical protein
MVTSTRSPVRGNGHAHILRTPAAGIPTDLLAVAIAKKLEGESLEPGEYHVQGEATIAVDCIISKAQPTSARAPFRCDLAAVLAVALQQAGIKPERVGAMVERAILDAHNGQAVQGYVDLAEAGVDRAAEQITSTLPSVARAGATSVKGRVELVKWLPS